MVQPVEGKNPVVIGRLGAAAGAAGPRPTVTFYGHYDVQPAVEPDWATNPFELNAVNEHLYGRGTSDNKVGEGRAHEGLLSTWRNVRACCEAC